MTELNQFLSIGLMGGRDPNPSSQESNDGVATPPFRLQDHPYLTPSGATVVRPDFGSKFGSLDTREQVTACVNLAKRAGLDFLVLDQTRPDIDVPVARVIVPGLRHFYRRFAAWPALRCAGQARMARPPLSESELNPLHPQT
jgi:Uncharacterized conserved protein